MNSEKKAGKAWTGYAGLAIGILLIAYLFSKVDIKGAVAQIRLIGFSSLLILIPYLFLHLIETVAWQRLFPVGSGPVPFFRLFRIQLVSETVSMTLPAGVAVGEPLRPWLCRKFLGIPLPDGFASVAVRKLLLGAAQGIYTLVGAVAGFAMLQAASTSLLGIGGLGIMLALAGATVTVAFLSMLILVTGGKAVQRLHRILMMVPFARVREWLLKREDGFVETDRKLQRVKLDGPASFLPLMLLYVSAWMTLAFESYLILQLLGVKVTFLQVLSFDTALAMLRTLFFFIPSGLGIQDLGYLAFFQVLGMHDFAAVGGAFVLLRRFKEVIWYATGYGVMFMAGIRLKDAKQVSEEGA